MGNPIYINAEQAKRIAKVHSGQRIHFLYSCIKQRAKLGMTYLAIKKVNLGESERSTLQENGFLIEDDIKGREEYLQISWVAQIRHQNYSPKSSASFSDGW